MIKLLTFSALTIVASTLPAWAHEQAVDHAHAGGLTIYAVPAFAIVATAAVVGFVAWNSQTNRKDH